MTSKGKKLTWFTVDNAIEERLMGIERNGKTFSDFVEVSSQNLAKRLETVGVCVRKTYTKTSSIKTRITSGDVLIESGDYVKPKLNRVDAPLWAITIMCSDLLAEDADFAVQRCLEEPEMLKALITLFVVLDDKPEWDSTEAAKAVITVLRWDD